MKKLILVTSPPACGKTYISRQLAKKLKHVIYLDKDTLIVLSKQIFVVAGEEYNRSSPFFEEHIRNYEYYAVIDLAIEALEFGDTALINAPFTREIRDMKYISDLKAKLAEKGIALKIIWVTATKETCHKRMIERGSDRDTWKLANWDEYISKQNFDTPSEINADGGDTLLIFNNNNEEEYNESMERISKILMEE